jgi:CheY-like chemotaxis protein
MTRVLVVDDEPPIAELVQEILQEEGYLVESAGSAAAAFGRIEQHWPDVMLLDLHMPTMDGWTFLRACRQDRRGADLRVVVMSGAAEQHRAEEVGVAFLAKPFDISILLRTVHDVLLPGLDLRDVACAA